MLAPLIKRCLWTVKRGCALLFPVAFGVLVSALLAGCAGTSASTAPSLLVFRDGLGNFGLYKGDGPIVALDAKNGHRLWQRALDTLPPGTHQVSPLLQPTVQEGLVYTPYTYRDPSKPISLQRAALEALDPATGQLRWRHEVAPKQNTNAELDSAPVVANGVVYVSSATFEPLVNGQTPTLHGLVEALDSHNGSMRWSAILQDPPTNPVIVGELILLRAGQMLVALNITDGSVAWTFTPPGGSFYDLDGGQPPYTSSVVTEGYPGPVVTQQLVFVEATEADSAGHGIGATWFAVKTGDGSLAWRSARSAPGAVFSRPVLNQSGSVLCTTTHASDSGDVVMGLSTTDGKTLWEMSTSAKLSVCAAAEENFYLTEGAQNTATGSIRALDSQTGRPLWSTPTKPPVIASGVAAPPQGNGLAAVYSLGPIPTGATPIVNTIAVVQLSTGNILWQHDVTGPSEIPVTILGDLVVIPEYSPTASTLAPMLVAYTLQTGSRTWSYTLGQA
jgi:outer membrane protein assembly factor BamB